MKIEITPEFADAMVERYREVKILKPRNSGRAYMKKTTQKLVPRKVRRAEWLREHSLITNERFPWAATHARLNPTAGPNRHERRATVKQGRLIFNSGVWVKPLAIAIRGAMRRAGMFEDGPSVAQSFAQKWIRDSYAKLEARKSQ